MTLLLEDRMAAGPTAPESTDQSPGERVEQAYARILTFDAEGLERLLWRAALSLGGASFLNEVVGPLLGRVGDAWAEGDLSPAQEHLGSAVVDQVLERLIAASRSGEGPALVVSTLPGERHGLGARLVSTAAVLKGWSVKYLGTDLPVSEIAGAARGVGAAAVAISVVRRDHLDETQRAITSLRNTLDPSIALLVGGRAASLIDAASLPDGIWIHDGLEQLPTPPTGRPRAG